MEVPLASTLILGVAAFVVAALTLLCGFGLGTLLLPAFALFFPVEVAVAATAVVHVANNLFKLGLLWRRAASPVVLRFGLPAVAAAFAGALLLGRLARMEPVASWQLGSHAASITPLQAVMGLLIVGFGLLELVPALAAWRMAPRWLPLGGVLSGFFGGLSGHQGALRAAFLLPLGLSPPVFASTQAVIACMVDASRLLVYGLYVFAGPMSALSGAVHGRVVAIATACAFAGSLLGRRLLPHVTVRALRLLAGGLLLVVGAGLASGLI